MLGAWNWRWFAVFALLAYAVFGGWGCDALQPRAFPSDAGMIMKQIGTSMADQAVWEELDTGVGVHVNNPGFRGWAAIVYEVGGQIIGLDGDFKLSGEGGGSGALTEEARQVILQLVNDPTFNEQLLALMAGPPAEPVVQPESDAPPEDLE